MSVKRGLLSCRKNRPKDCGAESRDEYLFVLKREEVQCQIKDGEIGGACSTNRSPEYLKKIYSDHLKGSDDFQELGVDGRAV